MNKVNNKNLTLSVVVEKDKDGYVVDCPQLQGCYAAGDTYEEAIANSKEAIALHLEDRFDRGDFLADDFDQEHVSLTTLSFAVPARHVA